jgi:hypothetical protein
MLLLLTISQKECLTAFEDSVDPSSSSIAATEPTMLHFSRTVYLYELEGQESMVLFSGKNQPDIK